MMPATSRAPGPDFGSGSGSGLNLTPIPAATTSRRSTVGPNSNETGLGATPAVSAASKVKESNHDASTHYGLESGNDTEVGSDFRAILGQDLGGDTRADSDAHSLAETCSFIAGNSVNLNVSKSGNIARLQKPSSSVAKPSKKISQPKAPHSDADETVHHWTIQDLAIEVVLKDIKNVHIAVYPPDGKVRVAAPAGMDHDMLRLAIVRKLGWIRSHRARLMAAERQPPRLFVAGESHYIFGTRYRLKIALGDRNEAKLEKYFIALTMHPATYASFEARQRFVESWFKLLLAQKVRELCLDGKINADLSAISIRKMRTKWFGANPNPHKAWINIELIKEPPEKLLSILQAL